MAGLDPPRCAKCGQPGSLIAGPVVGARQKDGSNVWHHVACHPNPSFALAQLAVLEDQEPSP